MQIMGKQNIHRIHVRFPQETPIIIVDTDFFSEQLPKASVLRRIAFGRGHDGTSIRSVAEAWRMRAKDPAPAEYAYLHMVLHLVYFP
jgi:hypothetical protein